MNQDLEHLRLLSIFHYVVAGITALFACIPLIHVFFGLLFVFAGDSFTGGRGGPPPPFIGWFFVIIGGTFVLAGWTLAIMILLGGRCLARHRNHTFCLVVAALSCLFMPFGTILGVFTIVVLMRTSVKELFH
jgi:hypothetical protein